MMATEPEAAYHPLPEAKSVSYNTAANLSRKIEAPTITSSAPIQSGTAGSQIKSPKDCYVGMIVYRTVTDSGDDRMRWASLPVSSRGGLPRLRCCALLCSVSENTDVYIRKLLTLLL